LESVSRKALKCQLLTFQGLSAYTFPAKGVGREILPAPS
jgi:hypothetical protein